MRSTSISVLASVIVLVVGVCGTVAEARSPAGADASTPNMQISEAASRPTGVIDCEIIRFEDLAKPSPYWDVAVLLGTLKSVEKLEPEWVGTEVHHIRVITVAVDEVFFNDTNTALTPGSDVVFTHTTEPAFVPEGDINSALQLGSRTILVLGEEGSSTSDGAIRLESWDFWVAPDLDAPMTEISGCASIKIHGWYQSLGEMTTTMEKVLDCHPSMRAGTSYRKGGMQTSGESGHSSLWSFARDAIERVMSAVRGRGG